MKIDIFIVLFVKENDQNGLDKIQWSQTSLLAKSLGGLLFSSNHKAYYNCETLDSVCFYKFFFVTKLMVG